MIYTITFNPALDYIMVVPSCRSGEVKPDGIRKRLWQAEKVLMFQLC